MKTVAILTLISAFCGSSLAGRYPTYEDYTADSWSDMYRDADDQSMTGFMYSDKMDVGTVEPDFAGVMDQVSEKLDSSVDQAMAHLNSVLMLEDSSKVSAELRSKIAEFKESLVKHFESDLVQVTHEFKVNRGVDGPLSDEERYEFSDLLKNRWEQTLTTDLFDFQKNILPRWVSDVRNTWKGIEKRVMDKIEKFKKFVHKTIPRSSNTCEIPSSVLVGSNAISAATRNLQKGSMQRMDRASSLTLAGKIAIFILAVVGVITLAIGAPFFFFFLGIFWLTDKISDMIFGTDPPSSFE